MKIGLYFGSFNPIHVGHLIIAEHVLNFGNIKQLWLVISPQNPLKQSSTLLNEYSRLHLIQTAVEGISNIKASKVEFTLPRPSFTVDTLTYLKEQYPQHEFAIVMGSDSFTNLTKWKNYEVLLKNHFIYIFIIPGFTIVELPGASIQILQAPLLEISSTHIRNLIKNKKSIKFLVPSAVEDEIETNNYYR